MRTTKSCKAWCIDHGNGVFICPILHYTRKNAQEICDMHKRAHKLKKNDWKVIRVKITEVK